MGLGKTVQAIGCINACPTIKTVLIICPKSLIPTWETMLEQWLTRPLMVAAASSKGSDALPEADILLINYEMVAKKKAELVTLAFDALICDEAHYLKNPAALRTKAVLGDLLKAENKREADEHAIRAEYLWLLTGSPMLNHPIELWPLLRAVDSQAKRMPRLMSFYGFRNRYCDPKKTKWGMDFSGVSNEVELRESVGRSELMFRRTKDEVLSELPPKRREPLIFEDQAAAAHEKKLLAELLEEQTSGDDGGDNPESDFARMVRALGGTKQQQNQLRGLGKAGLISLRQRFAETKVPLAVRVIQQMLREGRPGQKVVAFAHHVHVINALLEAFPSGQAVSFYGETSLEERQAAVERFQHDPSCRIFVGSIRTAGQGVTLTAASRVLFVELDWSPMVLAQAEDRCHRIGQTEPLLVQYLMIRGTLDERLGSIVTRKQSAIEPLYSSISVAQLPARDRGPEQLRAHIDEVRTKAERARAAYEAARRQRAEKLEALASDENRRRTELEAEAERSREKLEAQIRIAAEKARAALEDGLSSRRQEIEEELEAARQHQEAIIQAAKDAEEEARKELKRSETHQAKAQAAAKDQKAASTPAVGSGDHAMVDTSHDEDFGESD